MNFSDYLKEEIERSTNEIVSNVIVTTVKDRDLVDVIKSSNPQTWTAKIIDNVEYLIFNNKFLNVSKLKNELTQVYQENGYANYGFSRLTPSEIVRYKTLKNIIIPLFYDNYTDEIDAKSLATIIFNNEYTNLSWSPEEVIK